MPRSRDELVPIFNFGCRLWLRGIMASDHGDGGEWMFLREWLWCDFGPIWWCEFGPIRGGRIWCEMGPIYTLISWPFFPLPISRFVWDLPKRSPRMRQNAPKMHPKNTPKNTPFFPIFPQISPIFLQFQGSLTAISGISDHFPHKTARIRPKWWPD
jgi:hypothetical protein